MRVRLESTTKTVELNGVPARIWEGITEGGIPCHAYITSIACDKDDEATEFELDLKKCAAPSTKIEAIPNRMVS